MDGTAGRTPFERHRVMCAFALLPACAAVDRVVGGELLRFMLTRDDQQLLEAKGGEAMLALGASKKVRVLE